MDQIKSLQALKEAQELKRKYLKEIIPDLETSVSPMAVAIGLMMTSVEVMRLSLLDIAKEDRERLKEFFKATMIMELSMPEESDKIN